MGRRFELQQLWVVCCCLVVAAAVDSHASTEERIENRDNIEDETDVVVIGSGIAGLSCAALLASKGLFNHFFSVLLLLVFTNIVPMLNFVLKYV